MAARSQASTNQCSQRRFRNRALGRCSGWASAVWPWLAGAARASHAWRPSRSRLDYRTPSPLRGEAGSCASLRPRSLKQNRQARSLSLSMRSDPPPMTGGGSFFAYGGLCAMATDPESADACQPPARLEASRAHEAARAAQDCRPEDWRVQGQPDRDRPELQHQATGPGRRRSERSSFADHRPDQRAARAGAIQRREPASARWPSQESWRLCRRTASRPGRVREDRA